MPGGMAESDPDWSHTRRSGALAVMLLCMLWWLLTPVALPVTSLVGLALLPTL